jgi:hypothetical protein
LPVAALYLFGGAVLQDFAFAILIGIGISAFSTIFIAAPFLAVLLEHAPEYKGRVARARAEDEAEEREEKLVPVAAGVEGDGDAPIPAATPAPGTPNAPTAESKRERRRQRRRARPHGRAR